VRENSWTKDQLRRLEVMKNAGETQSVIAKDLGKTTTQVNNKWSYIQRNGMGRAMAIATGSSHEGNGRLSEAFREAAEAESKTMLSVESADRLSREEIRLAAEFVKALRGHERAAYVLSALCDCGVFV
jgi:hypothetical protein